MIEEHNAASADADCGARLSAEERQTLLDVARQTLTDYLGGGSARSYDSDSPALLEQRAAFVTLRQRKSGELRGCRGECVARRPLIESVAHSAIAAATDDPRFPSVTLEELPELQIEINALTTMSPIEPEEVIVGRHGLLMLKGPNTGLLLPQVPVTYGWDREQFLRGLSRKASLPDTAWKEEGVQLFAFESEVWGDED